MLLKVPQSGIGIAAETACAVVANCVYVMSCYVMLCYMVAEVFLRLWAAALVGLPRRRHVVLVNSSFGVTLAAEP